MAGNRLSGGFSEADHPRGANGRFAVSRYDSSSGKERIDDFSTGDYVRAYISAKQSDHGEIQSISHAKGEVKVNGIWHPFGAIYQAPRPVLNKLNSTIKMSKAIANANKRHGADDWSAADAVPAHLQSGKR